MFPSHPKQKFRMIELFLFSCLMSHLWCGPVSLTFPQYGGGASHMTYKFAQGLEQWLLKGHTCRVASHPDPDPERIYATVSCSLTQTRVPLSHCRINILSQQYKRLPSICISLETLLTSSWERPSVRTTRTLGMALRAPASAVKMDSFTCFIARPNARQQENTESIQIPASHFVSAPVTSDTVWSRTPEVCDGVFSSLLSLHQENTVKVLRVLLDCATGISCFQYMIHTHRRIHVLYITFRCAAGILKNDTYYYCCSAEFTRVNTVCWRSSTYYIM